MPDVTMSQASLQAQGFYVPQFELRIDGAGLPRDVLRDVVEIAYKDKVDEIDSCEITVNNWDTDLPEPAFKYVGSERLDTKGNPGNPKDPAALNWKLFDPCNKRVTVSMGYSGNLDLMMIGNFVTLEPNFPSSGPPTLQVRMLNELHKLRVKRYSDKWPKKSGVPMSDTEIAKDISSKRDPDLDNQKQFPIPLITNPAPDEPKLAYVGQKNQYDIDFLWNRARLRNYAVFLVGDGKNQSLYFGQSLIPEDPIVYRLNWGASLVDFKATLSTANQFRSVTVRGWDRATQKPIEEKVDLTDKNLVKLNGKLQHLLKQCDPREEFVEEVPVFDKDQARHMARDILSSQLKRLVRATGTTVGLPKLRAGSRVYIGKSVGDRLSGTYFVTATTHTINNSGYTTRFEARLEDTNGGALP